MDERALKAHRILDVQRQLHRIEEWKMSDLQRQLEELDASQQSLIRALNDDDALQGLFIDMTARRLHALSEQASDVGRAQQEQAQRLEDRAAQVISAERLCEGLDQEALLEDGKRQLRDILERVIGPDTPASRKIVER
jgi:hypothetical protein